MRHAPASAPGPAPASPCPAPAACPALVHTRFSIAADDNNEIVTSHTRSFGSIQRVVNDEEDPRHFIIQFNDSRPVAQCLAVNREEGVQIRQERGAVVPLATHHTTG